MNIPNLKDIAESPPSGLLNGINPNVLLEQDLHGMLGPPQKFITEYNDGTRKEYVHLSGALQIISHYVQKVANKEDESFGWRRGVTVNSIELTKEDFETLRRILRFEKYKL
jgi:hypothetical protein